MLVSVAQTLISWVMTGVLRLCVPWQVSPLNWPTWRTAASVTSGRLTAAPSASSAWDSSTHPTSGASPRDWRWGRRPAATPLGWHERETRIGTRLPVVRAFVPVLWSWDAVSVLKLCAFRWKRETKSSECRRYWAVCYWLPWDMNGASLGASHQSRSVRGDVIQSCLCKSPVFGAVFPGIR